MGEYVGKSRLCRRFRPSCSELYLVLLALMSGSMDAGDLRADPEEFRWEGDDRTAARGGISEGQPLGAEGVRQGYGGEGIVVVGGAADDPEFNDKGSLARYVVTTGNAAGPFKVEAELWYQPIGFRWAHNLAAYKASESPRMVRYYEEASRKSAVTIGGASVVSTTITAWLKWRVRPMNSAIDRDSKGSSATV